MVDLVKYDRVRVRGTNDTGQVLEVSNKRINTINQIQFVTVCLENGNIMVYDISELTAHPST